MKVTVLLSAGRHPVSGAEVLPRVEAQAVRLGAALGDLNGLHAGPSCEPAAAALGQGLSTLVHLKSEGDPVPALAAALAADPADVVLAGRCSQGQDESGMVPYMLAHALGRPIVADAVAILHGPAPGTIVVEQALEKGARRRVTVRTPCIVTVHPNAPPARPFAFGLARRGRVVTVEQPRAMPTTSMVLEVETRPYRARPKMMRGAPSGGSAAERLKAATGASDAGATRVMVKPDPDEAAREIIAYLRDIGVLAQPTQKETA